MPTRKGSVKFFTFAGITVYVHWLWFLVAVLSFQWRTHAYSSLIWNVLEYLSLFLIVLAHEFGHQLACRSVGGQTHDIVLWPLGGIFLRFMAAGSSDTANVLIGLFVFGIVASTWMVNLLIIQRPKR